MGYVCRYAGVSYRKGCKRFYLQFACRWASLSCNMAYNRMNTFDAYTCSKIQGRRLDYWRVCLDSISTSRPSKVCNTRDGVSPHECAQHDARSGGEKLVVRLGWYFLDEILAVLQPMWGTDDVAWQKGARDIVGVGVDTSVPLWDIDRLMEKADVSDTV